MANVIHKHVLLHKRSGREIVTLVLTEGATLLHFGMQRGQLCLWEKHNDELGGRGESRRFAIIGTGISYSVPPLTSYKYLAFVQEPEYVWHIFEVT